MGSRDKGKNKGPYVNGYIERAGVIERQKITKTLEENYMPYAMSVILSRALPQIDGFKPSHRKLLYTMYRMGLLAGKLTKSANIVGATMKLNPHGDAAIYETMVRMSRGHQALLHPYIESKGNFGKFYSRDMDYAASRYTEAKLMPICSEIFSDIDRDAVDFVANYDNSTVEPLLLPVKFPAILVNSNIGIAVSMASAICPFNLAEVCETAKKIINCEQFDILESLKGPDFPGGGFLIKDEEQFREIYLTGRGSFKIRSKYSYDEKNNCIDITEIPYTTTIEAIMEKIVYLVKQNKIKEISDIRDETDLNGLKLTLDLKRGTNPVKLMAKLFKYTPLEDLYSCNFNVLVDGTPKVMGIIQIVENWKIFRQRCVERKLKFELDRKNKRLHLTEGLGKILLDIDRAIAIIRQTEKEDEVIKNLVAGFRIDVEQAEYVAEIKLRNLNKQYILKKIEEKKGLLDDIEKIKTILGSEKEINSLIVSELEEISRKYGVARKTKILDFVEDYFDDGDDEADGILVNVFLTKEWYLKKITPSALRSSKTHKLKEGDSIVTHLEINNDFDLIFFSSKARAYKINLSCFEDIKPNLLGEYIPAKLNFDEDEKVVGMAYTKNYAGNILFFYSNGKLSKVSMDAYATKTKRKKLVNAFSLESSLVAIFQESDFEKDYILTTSNKKCLIFNSGLVQPKKTKDSKGILVVKLNRNCFLKDVKLFQRDLFYDMERFRVKSVPSAAKPIKPNDVERQLKLV